MKYPDDAMQGFRQEKHAIIQSSVPYWKFHVATSTLNTVN